MNTKYKTGMIHGPTIALITVFTVVSLWIFIKPAIKNVTKIEYKAEEKHKRRYVHKDFKFLDSIDINKSR